MANKGFLIITDISGCTEYLTKLNLEAGFLGYDYGEQTDTGGRVQEGSGFHCAHGVQDGTRVGIYLTAPRENSSDEVCQMLQIAMNEGYAGLRSYIEKDINSGKITAN
jgi:hypothetical protein